MRTIGSPCAMAAASAPSRTCRCFASRATSERRVQRHLLPQPPGGRRDALHGTPRLHPPRVLHLASRGFTKSRLTSEARSLFCWKK
jgi:hypothetical protein